MNLYIRYFDCETLVNTVDEALAFLTDIPEVGMNERLEAEVREYVDSDVTYPKRYKVRPRVYFIMIKTTAETMQDFKDKKALRPATDDVSSPAAVRQESNLAAVQKLNFVKEGWYEGELYFRRVVMLPDTGKFEYKDTHVVFRCKAMSGIDCYERIIEYVRPRVDARSQFPSAKGKNFNFKYLGRWKD